MQKPEFSQDFGKNSFYLKLQVFEKIDEVELIKKLDFFIFRNFVEIFEGIDPNVTDEKNWMEKYGTDFQYVRLKKLCQLIYNISNVIFHKFEGGISEFIAFLKTCRENKESGMFQYVSSRLSLIFHPEKLKGLDSFHIQQGYPEDLAKNMDFQIPKFNSSIFDIEGEPFIQLFQNFITSKLNLPYFTLVSTIKYKTDNEKPPKEFYNDCSISELSEISNDEMIFCANYLKQLIATVNENIFLIHHLEGNVVGETMQGGIFLLQKTYYNRINKLSSEEKKINQAFLNNKAFFMVLLGHEIAHEERVAMAPDKSILFCCPKKKIFETKNPVKPYDVGVAWQLFIAQQRITENDFYNDHDLTKLFLEPIYWNKETFNEFFERLQQNEDNNSTLKENEDESIGYRCMLSYVRNSFFHIIYLKCLI